MINSLFDVLTLSVAALSLMACTVDITERARACADNSDSRVGRGLLIGLYISLIGCVPLLWETWQILWPDRAAFSYSKTETAALDFIFGLWPDSGAWSFQSGVFETPIGRVAALLAVRKVV